MSISNLAGTGKIEKQLYYYTIFFRSYDNKKAGVFSFVSNYDISTKNELCQFIWDKGEGDTWKSIRVSGSYINVDENDEKIGFIRTTGTNISSYDININYSHYNATTNLVSAGNYTFTNAEINIYRYAV